MEILLISLLTTTLSWASRFLNVDLILRPRNATLSLDINLEALCSLTYPDLTTQHRLNMKVPRSRRRPNIQWDTRKRQVLCCLFRFFCRDNKKWEEIFSHMFRSHLLERGITGFIPFTTLNIQWVNMREHGDSIWHRVHIATDFRKDGEWQDIISSIHSTAQLLHLQIQEKDSDSVDISRWRHPATALTMRNRQAPAPAVPVSCLENNGLIHPSFDTFLSG